MISQPLQYFQDWVNWMEWCLLVCCIIFVSVFHSECLCASTWQWQIGIVAVFLGWIELIFFLSKLPLVGLYIVMFLEILKTILKLLLFSFLLMTAFGLAFYMAFSEPNVVVCTIITYYHKHYYSSALILLVDIAFHSDLLSQMCLAHFSRQ